MNIIVDPLHGYRKAGRASVFRIVLCALLLAAPVREAGAGWTSRDEATTSAATKPGEHWDSFDYQNRQRSYMLYIPASYTPAKPVPLLVVLHGGHGDAAKTSAQTGFKPVAEREGFLVLYPEGVDKHWNDGRETTANGVDDAGFISALIESISVQMKVDKHRIYVTGISNGGMMTQRLACEMPQRFAAFASVVANLPVSMQAACKPSTGVNLMMINGKADPLMPWAGGEIKKGMRIGLGGSVLSTRESVRFWADVDHCDAGVETSSLPDRDPTDNTRIERISYNGCDNGYEVVLYEIDGGGHAWPGSNVKPRLQRITGRMSQDMTASEVIWSFFDKHALQ